MNITINQLERNTAQFNLDQLNVGRGAFMNMLTESLKAEEVAA